MRYAFYTRKNYTEAESLKERIRSFLNKEHFEDNEHPDILIPIGGDGTFLEAIHKYVDQIDNIVVIPFMTGHVGFYIDYFPEDAENINEIIKDVENIKNVPMLEANIEGKTYYAVNEFSLGQFAHASAYDIYMNDEFLESYYGSGILFSTTYGSSAYNRSVGGPLIDTDLNAFVMSKIAPITSRQYNSIAAPMVFKDDKVIILKYKNRRSQTLTADNRIMQFDALDQVVIRKSKKTIKLHTKDKFGYLQRIRKAC